jgi:outer membrane protein assembly factor BamB
MNSRFKFDIFPQSVRPWPFTHHASRFTQNAKRKTQYAIRLTLLTLWTLDVGLWTSPAASASPSWLSWRGPNQTGFSAERGLPDKIPNKEAALWVADFPGQSTPVIARGRVYIMGYVGDGPDLQEGIACFDAETGKELWRHLFNDFLSDTIYVRYATSSPTIDPETGNIFMQGTQGILAAFTSDGKLLWHHSLMEEFGRLTFPNSRTGSPLIDGDLVITRGITANWGAQGPAADRFYAFDKKTGELVWASTPGDRPKDNSYSHPYLGWLDGKRVFYAATGDGSIVCVNARTGDPIWRVPVFKAGINATVVVHNNDKAIAVYGTPYEPGQMVALKLPTGVSATPAGPAILERPSLQLWALDLSTSSSSPILAGNYVYLVAEKGDLCAVDVKTGKLAWSLKLGVEERNSCPLYADGKLYVPMLSDTASGEGGNTGAFYIIKPSEKPEILSHIALDGRCFGSPTALNGKVYVQTQRHLYCFGKKGDSPTPPPEKPAEPWPAPGPAASVQIIPSEVLLRPGQTASFRARTIDANGFTVEENIDPKKLKWESYIPPTARVKSTMRADFNAEGQLVAANETVPSAGAFQATYGELKGIIRGRVLPYLPLKQDFEWMSLTETNSDGSKWSYPPLPWIGARFKFDVREKDGSKVMNKTIENKFFQRATVFLGAPDAKNYTIEADVMSDGNRRKMSEVGLVNQRYYIVLKGNDQNIEVNSNLERLRVNKEFKWQPKVWYRLKARVDIAPDKSGVVRAKAWKKDEAEPAEWTIEVPHKTAHQQGSPGLFGFSPQEQPVYIDNITVTPN